MVVPPPEKRMTLNLYYAECIEALLICHFAGVLHRTLQVIDQSRMKVLAMWM